MKTIGLLGGMSWESSALYYKTINNETKRRLGWLSSAKILMHSVNFAEIEALQHAGKWDELTDIMIQNAQSLEAGWADFVMICTNTMHKMAEDVAASISIPLLHLADATAEKIVKSGIKKVALLGTGFTMKQDFYKGRLIEKYGLEVLTPDEEDMDEVHRIIYEELCQWEIKNDSREIYKQIINKLKARGAQGVILWCTEITMLIKQSDSSLPVFDTTDIHAITAVDAALQ